MRRHTLLIALVALAAVAASAVWLARRSPDYEASAQVLVNPVAQDDATFAGLTVPRDTSGDPTRIVETAASLLDTPGAARLAANRLGPGWSPARVQAAVDIEPRGQTNILLVRAHTGRAAEAARVATVFTQAALEERRRALARQAAGLIAQLRGRPDTLPSQLTRLTALRDGGVDPTMALFAPAAGPGAATGARASLVLALALVAGLVLGLGAALVADLLNGRVRDEEELEELSGLPVLARVPRLPRRLAASGPLPPDSIPPDALEAFRTLRMQLDHGQPAPRALVVTSASSGDGKTSVAAGIAAALVAAGRRVILIDFDVRRPGIADMLGVDPGGGLSSLVGSGAELASALASPAGLPELLVLPAAPADGVRLEAIGKEMPNMLTEARQLAEYVVVDTPPLGEVSDALFVADRADQLLVVGRPAHTSRVSFERMRDLLDRIPAPAAGLVVVGQEGARRGASHQYGRSLPAEPRAERGVGELSRP